MSEIEVFLERAQKYCAYRERCQMETRAKLKELGASHDVAEEIISLLITKGFLNEQRFSQFFCSGKFRHNSWGRVRITRELEKRQISSYCIAVGLEEISEEEYITELKRLITIKVNEQKTETQIVKKNRIAQYCIRKGYESSLVWFEVNKLLG